MKKEDKTIVISSLINPKKELKVAQIAVAIAREAQKNGFDISCDLAFDSAILMNLGQGPISYIYAKGYSWDKHPEARDLNSKHGEMSVKIAEEFGIELTPMQKEAIIMHCKKEYSNALCQILKIAETYEAVQHKRLFDNKIKKPARSWEEIENILREDKTISQEMIEISKKALN